MQMKDSKLVPKHGHYLDHHVIRKSALEFSSWSWATGSLNPIMTRETPKLNLYLFDFSH